MRILINPKRGCGYLKEDAIYLRAAMSKDGMLPPIVVFKSPIPYLEQHFRSWRLVNGLQFELCQRPTTKIEEDEDYIKHYKGMWKKFSKEPPAKDELGRHIQRLEVHKKKDGEHFGEMGSPNTLDLMMWVGENFYPKPEDFIHECEVHGLNKRIPSKEPPLILPGKTKLYLAHPHALGEGHPGIFGFAYLTEIVYTKKKDGQIPKWIQDLSKIGRIEVVDVGSRVDNSTTTIDQFNGKK